jgi:hypothetical protein
MGPSQTGETPLCSHSCILHEPSGLEHTYTAHVHKFILCGSSDVRIRLAPCDTNLTELNGTKLLNDDGVENQYDIECKRSLFCIFIKPDFLNHYASPNIQRNDRRNFGLMLWSVQSLSWGREGQDVSEKAYTHIYYISWFHKSYSYNTQLKHRK